ncbi:hypothetical protein [Clostridium thermarum]|uniref:hypothetical protein n=1 Tax=Clostridium thermarum TaxID=1716543 RepID=UPI00111CA5C0|nr:hypothetical protein [Clostridium thermarum]
MTNRKFKILLTTLSLLIVFQGKAVSAKTYNISTYQSAVITLSAAKVSAAETLVNKAIKELTYTSYVKAQEEIKKVKDQKERNRLYMKLDTVRSKIINNDIKRCTDFINKISQSGSAERYYEFEKLINTSKNIKDVDKELFKKHLTALGKNYVRFKIKLN